MRLGWLWWALLAALLCVLPPPAWAEADSLALLPPEVHTVATVGRWLAEGRGGPYRVVVLQGGADAPVTRVFVQWLADGGEGAPAVAASAEIGAFAELAGATLLRPEWHARWLNRLELDATARTPDGHHHRVRQVATMPGRLEQR